MSDLRIDVNKDGLLDKVSWVWRSPSLFADYLEPRATVEIATNSDNYVLLDKLPSLKFEGKEFKVGELIKPKKDSDIDRRIYAFTAETKEVQNKVSGHWEYCLQVYLKVEPIADDKEHKRSKRELGEAICHPKLFGDEPTEISLSGVPG